MKRLLIALMILCAWTVPPARADLGGTVPSPGNCDYPATGGWGEEFGVYHSDCRFPVEINGSRHTCRYYGASYTANVGVSFMFVNASITSPVGVLEGVCYFACPDLSMSADPNPPGSWKSYLIPSKCKTIGPDPVVPNTDPAPPNLLAPTPPPPYTPPANNLAPANTNPDTAGK